MTREKIDQQELQQLIRDIEQEMRKLTNLLIERIRIQSLNQSVPKH